jgi:hypothetical protein
MRHDTLLMAAAAALAFVPPALHAIGAQQVCVRLEEGNDGVVLVDEDVVLADHREDVVVLEVSLVVVAVHAPPFVARLLGRVGLE